MADQVERKRTRRKGGPIDSPVGDNRRKSFERRGTLTQAAPPTREQVLYGERRRARK